MSIEKRPEYILYFASTHWDREWYRTFQDFRIRLVNKMNKVLDVLEQDSDFSAFITDGQVSMIEDYLEAMPQNKERVVALVSAGRLRMGPWYTMPDENLSSGETLVRNLAMGHKEFEKLVGSEGALKLGYVCDIFGHIAQMPRIFKGFGIELAILGRGTNNYSHPAFFEWQAPGGAACTVFKVPEECGYGTFWLEVFSSGQGAENAKTTETFEKASQYVESELKRTHVPFVVLMDGMDHEGIHTATPWLAKKLAEKFGCDVGIGQVEKLVDALQPYRHSLPIVKGELQAPAKELAEHNKLISNTLSSRYDIKKLNDTTQIMLEKEASVLLAIATARAVCMPFALLDRAYKYLLMNSAHDSICGCSRDEVHRDMMYRYHQAQRIGEGISFDALKKLYDLEVTENAAQDLTLTLFNPLPVDFNGVSEITIDFPVGYTAVFDEQIPSELVNQFRIYDALGQEVPYQIQNICKNSFADVPDGLYLQKRDRYQLFVKTAIPATGAAVFTVKQQETPVRFFENLKTGNLCAENESLALQITPLGQVELTTLWDGHVYTDLLQYSDVGETGDGWFHRAPVPDVQVYTMAAVSVETLHNGPVACTFRITHVMHLPKKMNYTRMQTKRSAETVAVKVYTTLELRAGCPYVGLGIEVENTATDHQLALSIASGIDSDCYEANQAFAFVRRQAGIEAQTHNWKEPDKAEKSFCGIVAKRRADNSGFAFVSPFGLHEAAVHKGKEGRIDITLMRCFEKIFLGNGQPDGQLQGRVLFKGALYPFAAGVTNAQLLDVQEAIQVQPRCFTCGVGQQSLLKIGKSFVKLESVESIRMSIMKPSADGGVVIRLVNYGKAGECSLVFDQNIAAAYEADLLEQQGELICRNVNKLQIQVDSYEIKTLLLRFEAKMEGIS